LKDFYRLGKFSIIFPVSFTAFTGYFLYRPIIDINLIMVVAGVFLLGSAASALNQIQERDIDALMERTRKRPLAVRSMTRGAATLFFFITLLSGSVLLYIFGSGLSMSIGLFTIVWYNGLYTYLKRLTAFAAVPGALTGAMPPLIGWTAAGGQLTDYTALLLSFLLFIGQVPHFWLLILIYGNQYKKAGLPNLTNVFTLKQITRVTWAWIMASFMAALLLAWFGIMQNETVRLVLLLITLSSMIVFTGLLARKLTPYKIRIYFILLNSYFMLVMLLLVIDKIAA